MINSTNLSAKADQAHDAIPEAEHDFSVDVIVTADEVIECDPSRRPSGLYWEHLSADRVAAIPVLAARAAAGTRQPGQA